jgi:hypothetical protein
MMTIGFLLNQQITRVHPGYQQKPAMTTELNARRLEVNAESTASLGKVKAIGHEIPLSIVE